MHGNALYGEATVADIKASLFSGPTNSAKTIFFQTADASPGPLNDSIVAGGCNEVSVMDTPSYTCTTLNASDTRLGLLQDNGGPTWTMLPAADSPALDAATCSAGTTDQRGVARPAGACDIGAGERQPTAPDTPTGLVASTDPSSWPAAPAR